MFKRLIWILSGRMIPIESDPLIAKYERERDELHKLLRSALDILEG